MLPILLSFATLEYTITSKINQQQLFCLQLDYYDKELYDIKVSFLGSIGIDMMLYWQSENDNIIPMDTVKLRFRNDESRNQNCFNVVGFPISQGWEKLEEKDKQFQYIIKLEKVLIDDLNYTYLLEYLFVIIFPLIIVQFITK